MNRPGRRKVAAGSVNTKPRAVLDSEGYVKKQEAEAQSSKTSSETVSVKTTTEEVTPTPQPKDYTALVSNYYGNEENPNAIIQRDLNLVNGTYLNIEGLKERYPEAYSNLEEATKKARSFYDEFDNLNSLSSEIEAIKKDLNVAPNTNSQEAINAYNAKVKEFQKKATVYNKRLEYRSVLSKDDIYQSEIESYFAGTQNLLSTKKSVKKGETTSLGYNEVEFGFDFDTYDLLPGSELRSRGSIQEFDLADKAVSSVGYTTNISQYGTFDFLNSTLDKTSDKVQADVKPMFISFLDKGLNRLGQDKKEEIDLVNPKNMDIFIGSLMNSMSDITKKSSGVNIDAIQKKLDGAENLAQKNRILITHSDDFKKVIESMTTTELQNLYNESNTTFNDKFYFTDADQQAEFLNNTPTLFKDIEQTKEFINGISSQANKQNQLDINNQYQSLVEGIIFEGGSATNIPEPIDAFGLVIRKYIANNIYDENTGANRSLDEIMSMFQEENSEDVRMYKDIISNQATDSPTIKTGFGEMKMQSPTDILRGEFILGTERVKIGAIDDKKVRKKLKQLQKKYEKTVLPEGVEYIPFVDGDGNTYYETERIGLDEQGNKISLGAGVPITNPKDVKRIKLALMSNDEIESEIQFELEKYTNKLRLENKELNAEDLISEQALKVWAASELNIEIDKPKNESEPTDLSWWDAFKIGASSTWDIATTPSSWFDSAAQNIIRAENISDFAFKKAGPTGIENAKRKSEIYLNVLSGSEEGGVNNVRNEIYNAYADVTTGIQKQMSKVKVDTTYPTPTSLGPKQIYAENQDAVMNPFSSSAGSNIMQAPIKNYKDIDLNKSDAEKTKAVSKILEISAKSNSEVIAGEFNYTGVRKKNPEQSKANYTALQEALDKAKAENKKIEVNYYPYAMTLNNNAYEFKVGDQNFVIYANKEEMYKQGELIEQTEQANTDYRLIERKGGWDFSKLDNSEFKNNRVTLDKDRNIIWEYKDKNGESVQEKLPIPFGQSTSIDELEGTVKDFIYLLTNP
jgi:hypothetical protein